MFGSLVDHLIGYSSNTRICLSDTPSRHENCSSHNQSMAIIALFMICEPSWGDKPWLFLMRGKLVGIYV